MVASWSVAFWKKEGRNISLFLKKAVTLRNISGLSSQKKGRKSSSPSNWSPTHHRHPHSDPHCYISCMEHLKPNLSVKYRVNFCTCLRR